MNYSRRKFLHNLMFGFMVPFIDNREITYNELLQSYYDYSFKNLVEKKEEKSSNNFNIYAYRRDTKAKYTIKKLYHDLLREIYNIDPERILSKVREELENKDPFSCKDINLYLSIYYHQNSSEFIMYDSSSNNGVIIFIYPPDKNKLLVLYSPFSISF